MRRETSTKKMHEYETEFCLPQCQYHEPTVLDRPWTMLVRSLAIRNVHTNVRELRLVRTST